MKCEVHLLEVTPLLPSFPQKGDAPWRSSETCLGLTFPDQALPSEGSGAGFLQSKLPAER